MIPWVFQQTCAYGTELCQDSIEIDLCNSANSVWLSMYRTGEGFACLSVCISETGSGSGAFRNAGNMALGSTCTVIRNTQLSLGQ